MAPSQPAYSPERSFDFRAVLGVLSTGPLLYLTGFPAVIRSISDRHHQLEERHLKPTSKLGLATLSRRELAISARLKWLFSLGANSV